MESVAQEGAISQRGLRNHKWGPLSCVISLALIVIHSASLCQTMDEPFQQVPSNTAITLSSVIGSLQLICLAVTFVHLSLCWRTLEIVKCWTVYMGVLLCFTGLYLYIHLMGRYFKNITFFKESFRTQQAQSGTDALLDVHDRSAISTAMLFLYFSTTTQTSVGFGDITPAHPLSQLLVCAQMIFGMLYVLIIISHTVSRLHASTTPSRVPERRRSTLSRMGAIAWVRKTRRWARDNLLLVTLLIQALDYLMLLLVGGGDEFAVRDQTYKQGHRSTHVDWFVAQPEIVSLVIQLLNITVVLLVALKYVRKTYMVQVGFLIQACLATTLAFTGMHVTIFLLDDARAAYWVPCKIKSTSRCEQAVHQDDNPDTNFWAIVADFCYFSFAIMTTTGYGDMFARSFFARLVVTLQMLTANLLSVVIVALGLHRLTETVHSTPASSLIDPEESHTAVAGLGCDLHAFDEGGRFESLEAHGIEEPTDEEAKVGTRLIQRCEETSEDESELDRQMKTRYLLS